MTTRRRAPVVGTSLQGYVTASYAALVGEFGDPAAPHDADKSHVEWSLDSPYLGPVTIYDYGDVHDCDGNWYVPMAESVEWHVGGHDRAALDWVARRLGVQPHNPVHAGCCRPVVRPWWIEELHPDDRDAVEQDHDPDDLPDP